MRATTSGLVLCAAMLFGCGDSGSDEGSTNGEVTPDDVKRELGEAGDAAAKLFKQKKKELQESMNGKLAKLNKKIAELEAKAKELQGEAKKQWEEKYAKLKEQRKALRKELEKVGGASSDAWDDVKEGATSAWKELQKAFDDAAGHFQ